MSADPDRDFDALFPGALRAAGEVFPDPPGDLVARGIARGRHMRRARTVRVSATAVSLALVVVGGAVVGTKVLSGSGSGVAAAAPTPRQSLSASPSAPGVSDQSMISSLESLLPSGATFSDATGRGAETDPVLNAVAPFASVVVHTDGGSSEIDVDLYRVAAGTPVTATSYSSCPGAVEHPYGSCTSHTLADGSLLKTAKDFTRPQTNTGQKLWSATVIRGDGSIIEVTEYGGGAEKSVTNPVDPILPTDQLAAIAQSGVWQPALALINSPGGQTAAAPAFVPQEKVMATLISLLPSGLKKSDQSGQNGFAELVIDDGRGKTAVEINVQPNMAGLAGSMNCASHAGQPGTCTASTLPDGTKEVVTRGASPSGNGAVVQWRVDALRPDGLRVVVFEFNAASASGPVTRSEPALTVAQLSQIATSQLWQQ